MDLIMLVLVIALVGFAVWALTQYVPMPPIFKTAIIVLVVIVLVLWVLRSVGGGLPNFLH